MDDYKVWFEARNKRSEELGLKPWKMYEVHNRTYNMVCVITPELTPKDLQDFSEKYGPDERIAELTRERREKKVLIDGTTESYRLTSD